MKSGRKKIPYGLANFEKLIRENYIFIDKTNYIEQLENLEEQSPVFLRPRKFGKTLFISMLKYYYDINEKESFNDLFGEFYAGKNPAERRNSYLVLSLNFTGIETRTYESTFQGFFRKVKQGVEKFLEDYNRYFTLDSIKLIRESTRPEEIIMWLFTRLGRNKVYLLIDEYDHFANELLSFRDDLFSEIVSKTGFVRKFYEEIKAASESGVVDRIYITGVSPVTLDSLTSGFNIKTYIGNYPQFNAMIGFTEHEVKNLIRSVSNRIKMNEDEIYDILKLNYDGYIFNEFADESTEKVFNSDMVLYFLNHVIKTGTQPADLIDFNITSDYAKISYLFELGKSKIKEKIIDDIVQTGKISGFLTKEYSLAKGLTKDDIVSLLYYLGMLTIGGKDNGEIKFIVPNYVIHTLYWKYFLDELTRAKILDVEIDAIKSAVNALAYQGDPGLFMRETEKVLKQLSNRDLMKFDEKYIKLVMMLLLNLTPVYYLKSEYEEGGGYADLLLMAYEPYGAKYNYIFEIKYIKKKDCSDKEIRNKKDEATKQLRGKYLSDQQFVRQWGVIGYVLIFSGTECVLQEKIQGKCI